VKRLYDDLCESLRVPGVPRMFRTLANQPAFAESAWNAIRAVVRGKEFEQDADWIRTAALLEPVPIGRTVRSAAGEEIGRFRQITDTVHYVMPKVLLISSAFEAMLHTRDGGVHPGPRSGPVTGALPRGPAPGTVLFATVSPTDADSRVRRLYEDILRVHGHSTVEIWFRALATRPHLLSSIWDQLRPIVGSDPWNSRKRLLLNASEGIAREWNPPDLPSEVVTPEARALVAAFRRVLIPDVLMDVCLVKGMLDGAQSAMYSRFSAVSRPPAH
jgi:hypothetical protein